MQVGLDSDTTKVVIRFDSTMQYKSRHIKNWNANESVDSLSKGPHSEQNHKVGVPLFLQRSADKANITQQPTSHVDVKHAKYNGSPLPNKTREGFETHFNTDLSQVRIHSDEKHQQLAKSLKAKAFTTGNDIVFAKGKFSPESHDGKKLLAHELTHVVQQKNNKISGERFTPSVQLSRVDSEFETQADNVASDIATLSSTSANNKIPNCSDTNRSDTSTANHTSTQMTIQREEDEEQENGFDYSILPPSLSYRYGPLSLSANTSTAQMGMDMFGGNLGLGYHYGDPHGFPAMWGDYRSRYGADASQGNAFMTGSYGNFHAGIGTNFQDSFNLGIGYGAPLLPMPNVLGAEANAAWPAAYGVAGAAPSFFQDPMGAYRSQEANIGALSDMGGTASDIYNQQQAGGMQFGIGAQLMYDPLTQYRFNFGMQGAF